MVSWSVLLFMWGNAIAMIALVLYLTRKTNKAASEANDATKAVITHFESAYTDSCKTSAETIRQVSGAMDTALGRLGQTFDDLQKHSRIIQVGQSRDLNDAIRQLVSTNGYFNLKLLQTFLVAQQKGQKGNPVDLLAAIDRIATQEINLGGNNERADLLREETVPPGRM